MYQDTTNVDPEMYDFTGNKWSDQNSNKMYKEKYGSNTRKTFSRLPTKDSFTGNITHNTEKDCSLKLEAWVVGITVGSGGEVPGRKGLWQQQS